MTAFRNSMETLKQSLQTLSRILRMLAKAEPVGVFLLLIITSFQAVLPAATLLLTKWTVDEITALGIPGEAFPLLTLVSLWVSLQLVQPFLDIANQLLQGNIAERFTAHINLSLMDKAESLLGLDVLENKTYHDDIKIIQDGASHRPMNLVVLLTLTARDLLTIVSLMAVLATLAWWVPFALLTATLPSTLAVIRLRDLGFEALLSNNEDGRRMAYTSRIALGFQYAQEVRLFRLISWLKEHYSELFRKTHTRMRSVRQKEMSRVLPTYTLSVGASASLFAWAVWRASLGLLSAGQVVIIVQALSQLIFALRDTINYIGFLHEGIRYFQKYLTFLDINSGVSQPELPISLPTRMSYSIQFDGVSFAYPDGREALKNVSFTIEPGETIALVGENGAGKSTIVKLLLRFYDPSSGGVFVEGQNLKTLDLGQWRNHVSTVFQDFNHYEFNLRVNLALGNLAAVDEEAKLLNAADQAALSELIHELSDGLDTVLGKEFGGTELSGGQWQKIAIARALFRDAGVLVLDEPTASIDPRSEHRVFQRFADMAREPTTILITHRLASVSMADRILVLKNGELVESGTHKELLSRGGEYAELWAMQSESYVQLSHVS